MICALGQNVRSHGTAVCVRAEVEAVSSRPMGPLLVGRTKISSSISHVAIAVISRRPQQATVWRQCRELDAPPACQLTCKCHPCMQQILSPRHPHASLQMTVWPATRLAAKIHVWHS